VDDLPGVAGPEPADLDPGDGSSSGGSSPRQGESREATNQPRPTYRKVSVNPCSIRFSQSLVQSHFHDKRPTAKAVGEIRGRLTSTRWLGDFLDRKQVEPDVHLHPPFPYIRVLAGADSQRYLQKYGKEAHGGDSESLLYTIDNRRLFCLQQAAMRRWPKRCTVDVLVTDRLPYQRHAKKFDNHREGHCVQVGDGRAGSDIGMWCWFDEAVERERPNFCFPADCILTIAKVIPVFLLLRDRMKPFLGQAYMVQLILALTWVCGISWFRSSFGLEAIEGRVLQHHCLRIANGECFVLTPACPPRYQQQCPPRASQGKVPFRGTLPQLALTLFYFGLCSFLYPSMLPAQYKSRVQRWFFMVAALLIGYLYTACGSPPRWTEEMRP